MSEKQLPGAVPTEWLRPGAVVPVTPESVQCLLYAVKAATAMPESEEFTAGRAQGLAEALVVVESADYPDGFSGALIADAIRALAQSRPAAEPNPIGVAAGGRPVYWQQKEWVDPVALGSVNAQYDQGFADGISESKRLNDAPAAEPKRDDATYPSELTPELRYVLGFPNFRCSPYAEIYRTGGHEIKRRSEDEQAFVLHRFTLAVIEHGSKWDEAVAAELEAIRTALPSQPAGEVKP